MISIVKNILFIGSMALLMVIGKVSAQDTTLKPVNPPTPERVKVNNIFIVGNEKTQKSIILRELDFDTDFYYEWETFLGILEADQQKIYNILESQLPVSMNECIYAR